MAKGKFGGIGGGMNMQAMIKHAQKMQQEMLRAQTWHRPRPRQPLAAAL